MLNKFTTLILLLFTITFVGGSTVNAYSLSDDSDRQNLQNDKTITLQHCVEGGSSININDNNMFNTLIDDATVKRARSNMPSVLQSFTTAIYKPTLYSDYNSINDIKTNQQYKTNSWRIWNGISHWFNIKVTDIKAVRGVYSHFPTYSKEVLESSNVSVSLLENIQFNKYNTVTLNFSESADKYISDTLCVNLGITLDKLGDVKGALINNGNLNLHYGFDTYYSYSKYQTKTLSSSLCLNSNTSKYCPQGYYISLGYVGNYYVISYEYQLMKNVWFKGDVPASNLCKGYAVLVDENKLSLTYILLEHNNNSTATYYC